MASGNFYKHNWHKTRQLRRVASATLLLYPKTNKQKNDINRAYNTNVTVSCGTVKSYYMVTLKVTQPQGGLREQGWLRGLKEWLPAPLAWLDRNPSLSHYT